MKVVILLNSLSGGGAERAMKILAMELSNFGELTFIGINESEADNIPLYGETYELGRQNKSGILSTLKFFLKYFLITREIKPDYVVVNCALSELFSLLSPLSSKLIIVEHANPAWGGREMLGKLIRGLLSRRASKVVAVSSHLTFSHSNRPIDAVIANAQTAELLHARVVNSIEFESISINSLAFIGRLVNPQKRPELVLEIAEQCNLPVAFYGMGPEQDRLKICAKSKSLEASFLGFVPNVWECVPLDCLVIVPSLFEGDGLVVTEAILLNRPIALSNIPEFRRFGLNPNSYFTEVEELVARLKNTHTSNAFLAPEEIRKKMILERNPKVLAEIWNKFLVGI